MSSNRIVKVVEGAVVGTAAGAVAGAATAVVNYNPFGAPFLIKFGAGFGCISGICWGLFSDDDDNDSVQHAANAIGNVINTGPLVNIESDIRFRRQTVQRQEYVSKPVTIYT